MVVTLFSLSQTILRVTLGALSDKALHGWQWKSQDLWLARPVFLVVASLIMAVGHSLMMAHSFVALLVGVVCVGMAFGAVFPMELLLVADLFGLKSYGANLFFVD